MRIRVFFRRRAAELTAGLTALICLLLVLLIHRDPGFNRYANGVTPFTILQPESVTEETVEGYAGLRRSYTFTLPESESLTTVGARVSFFLRHTVAAYSIDGTSLSNDLAEEEGFHIGKTPGSYWVNIPLRPAYAGKTLRVTLTPVYPSVRDETPTFLVITRDALLTMVELPQNGLLLVLSGLAIAAGLFLALIVLALPLGAGDRKRVFYLGAVTAAAGLWKLCGLPILTLVLDYRGLQKELWFAGAAGYLLMLVLSLRLLTAVRGDGENRIGQLCFYLSAALAAALLGLQMLGVLELHEALIPFGVGMAILHVVSLLGKKPSRSELFWLLPFFLALIADLCIYYMSGSMQKAPVFLIWMILNLFVRGVGFVRSAILRERLLRRREEELRNEKLRAMMSQMRPHFIYNTLTSIYELCREDPSQAMRVIDDFTAYLQANFNAITATELIPFSEELRHTRTYLAVETALHGDDLSVDYDLETVAFRLPPLTLQPIVENAVKHGLGPGFCPVHIVIRTRAVAEGIRILVENDGAPYDPPADRENRGGLQNVRERLTLMCGGTLTVRPLQEQPPRRGTVAAICLNPTRLRLSDKPSAAVKHEYSG
ncbi:MAG: histidine kinase [Oscillospiraceae bacterium]|nr:histidine kinase [Oscillospiraceae bacterium]